jgi:hypothetical protein
MERLGTNPNAWGKAAGVSESTIRNFLAGDSDSLSDRSYHLLAIAADLTVAVLQGEKPAPTQGTVQIPVNHYIGAGDEVFLFEDNAAIDYVPAPPGYEKGGAAVVRGQSGRPMYEQGDVLFYREREAPPKRATKRAVMVYLDDDRLFLKKLLPGSKPGRYHLLSINAASEVLTDVKVLSIARVGWVKPSED